MTDSPPTTDAPADGEARIRRALRVSLLAGIAIAAIIGVTLWLTGRSGDQDVVDEHQVVGPTQRPTTGPVLPALPFTDITARSGIDFVHETGAYGERLLPETMGGGIAFLDYDNDGDQDLLLVNSTVWPWRPEPPSAATSALYRNRGDGTFEDVSEVTDMALTLYGMGVATGDYDGDGFVDVFITAVGENRLLRNVDGRRFVDVTADAGVAGGMDAWSTSAAFLDIDGDRDLDLFVCNYVAWSPDIDREVDYRLTGIGRAYGPPTDFPGTDSYLYRNDNGVFTDVSAQAGIEVANPSTGQPVGKALAVLPRDVNGDSLVDIAVANDTVRNFLFLNTGDGRFREAGIDTGLAFDAGGAATGAMGIDAATFDNDDKLAVAIGNFANEMSSFYVARPGEGLFSDDAIVSGVGAPSRRALTFGVFFFDADLDGRLDMLAANGHVEPEIRRVQSSQSYAQPTQLFWNCGKDCPRRYELSGPGGRPRRTPIVGRGAAYADIDDDGDLDIAITQAGAAAVLLRNDQTLDNNWVRLRLVSDSSNTHAIGATVTATIDGHRLVRVVNPARSYLSSVELPLTLGLGDAPRLDELTIRLAGWHPRDLGGPPVQALLRVTGGLRTVLHGSIEHAFRQQGDHRDDGGSAERVQHFPVVAHLGSHVGPEVAQPVLEVGGDAGDGGAQSRFDSFDVGLELVPDVTHVGLELVPDVMHVGLELVPCLHNAALDLIDVAHQMGDVVLNGGHAHVEGGFAVGWLAIVHDYWTYCCRIHGGSVPPKRSSVNIKFNKNS